MGELKLFCRRRINVELGVDFANWINVDKRTLFRRCTFNMSETNLQCLCLDVLLKNESSKDSVFVP